MPRRPFGTPGNDRVKDLIMSLKEELGFKKPINLISHEALLNLYYTSSCIKKRADEFFRPFGLTDVQFNLMALLKYQTGGEPGLSQAVISDMMLVNRANITSLVDRMEKSDLVKRTPAENDRRYNIVVLTSNGCKLFDKVEPLYAHEVERVMSPLNQADKKKLVTSLEKIRSQISL